MNRDDWSKEIEEELILLIKDWLRQVGKTQSELCQSLNLPSARMQTLIDFLKKDFISGGIPQIANRLCEIDEFWNGGEGPKLKKNIDNIPNYLRDLIDRRWDKTPNTKESLDGSTKLLRTKLKDLEEEFKNLISIFSKDLKDGTIRNIDPAPIAIIHSAMIIWEEELKNKYNKKNKKIINKNLLNYLEQVFDAFSCDADIKSNYYNWEGNYILACFKPIC